jgi:uncharacterized protein YdeI (YjbR/CyaY-like superfamily)
MATRDPRIDTYITKQQEFAKPILTYLREVIHEGCPEVVETLKWSAPAFEYEGFLCGFAAFKEHAALGFWKGTLILGPNDKSIDAAGSFGRLKTLKDLPPKKVLIGYVKKAVELNEQGVKAPMKSPKPKAAIAMPADLEMALAKNRKAKATYDGFSPSHKREYLVWITEAKATDTRKRRLSQAIEWMSEGKPRMWKYQK